MVLWVFGQLVVTTTTINDRQCHQNTYKTIHQYWWGQLQAGRNSPLRGLGCSSHCGRDETAMMGVVTASNWMGTQSEAYQIKCGLHRYNWAMDRCAPLGPGGSGPVVQVPFGITWRWWWCNLQTMVKIMQSPDRDPLTCPIQDLSQWLWWCPLSWQEAQLLVEFRISLSFNCLRCQLGCEESYPKCLACLHGDTPSIKEISHLVAVFSRSQCWCVLPSGSQPGGALPPVCQPYDALTCRNQSHGSLFPWSQPHRTLASLK